MVVKPKLKSIRVYEDTLDAIRKIVASDPRQTIIGFYDNAAKEKLKTVYEQTNAGSSLGGQDHSESPKI